MLESVRVLQNMARLLTYSWHLSSRQVSDIPKVSNVISENMVLGKRKTHVEGRMSRNTWGRPPSLEDSGSSVQRSNLTVAVRARCQTEIGTWNSRSSQNGLDLAGWRQSRAWQVWSPQKAEFSILMAAHFRTGHVTSGNIRRQVQDGCR